MTGLRELVHRLARPPEEIREDNLQHWARSVPGATPISELKVRERNKVAGVIQNVRIDPRAGRGFIEATLIDGSGASMMVRLTGRTTLAGWRLGEGLIVEGIVGEGDDGPLMLNPTWDLISSPEHA